MDVLAAFGSRYLPLAELRLDLLNVRVQPM
jgi:hypothetical protein